MAVITGYYANWLGQQNRSIRPGDQSPICGNQWSPPQSSSKRLESWQLFTLGIKVYQGIKYSYLPGEPLTHGYYILVARRKERQKVHVHKTNAKTSTQNWWWKNNTVIICYWMICQFHVTENTFEWVVIEKMLVIVSKAHCSHVIGRPYKVSRRLRSLYNFWCPLEETATGLQLNNSHLCLLECTVTLWLIASICFCWNNKCFTCGGYRNSQSSSIIHQYTTLTSPDKGETAAYGSPTFLLNDWGGDHWLPQIGLRSPGHGSTLLTWSVGVIFSDYCHLSTYV